MRRSVLLVAAFALGAACFPGKSPPKPSRETNCGPRPCMVFDKEEQGNKDEGIHEFKAPSPGDRRGPCPGLNAAANHGYIPHNGITTLEQAVTGLAELYGMGADLSALLAAYAIAVDGDVASGTFSIGGPYKGSIFGRRQPGLSNSHNTFEGDSSTARSDAYMNNGDASSLNITKFAHLYSLGRYSDFNDIPQIDYFIEDVRRQFKYSQDDSIANNPFYFNAPFSGVIVVPAAHHFLINFFSNHTPLRPNGYLDSRVLRRFFGVDGDPRPVKGQPKTPLKARNGQEQIPKLAWQRRPSLAPYTFADLITDLTTDYKEHPSTLRIGGNTGKPNSYVGVSVSDLTNGSYTDKNLLDGTNLGCFALQAMQAELPSMVQPLLGDLSPALELLGKHANPLLANLNCSPLKGYNRELLNKFPGYKKGKRQGRKGLGSSI